MADALELIGGPGTLIGILIVPLVLSLARRTQLWLRRRRYLGFGAHGLDIVLPATPAQAGAVVRPTTGLGSVQALGIAARVIGRHYRALPFRVHLATDVGGELVADLLCIGGPRANDVSRRFLERVSMAIGRHVVFDDVGLTVRLPGFESEGFELQVAEGLPRRDLGLLVLSRNPFNTTADTRGVLCCGFTSYGTAATAAWFFEGIVEKAAWATDARRSVPKAGPGASDFYIAAVAFTFQNGVVLDREVLVNGVFRKGATEGAGSARS